MSWQQITPNKPSYSERKTNFLNNGGKSTSFNSGLVQSKSDNPLAKPLSNSSSGITRPTSSPSPNKVPPHLQKILNRDNRKRGVTVATTSSEDSPENRRKDLLGSHDDSIDENLIINRERSKSYEVLPTWDYTPFTFKINQNSSINQYINDQDDDDEEELAELRFPKPPPKSPRSPSTNNNTGSPNNSASTTASNSPSTPSAMSPITLSGSFSMDLLISQQDKDLSPIASSPLSASVVLHTQPGDLIPNPNPSSPLLSQSLTSSGTSTLGRSSLTSSNSIEYTFSTTVTSPKLIYEKYPDDPSKFMVISGPKHQLLEYLCNKNKLDIHFVNTFILTFRYYITVHELFDFLISKFNLKAPTTSSSKVLKQFEDIIEKIKQNVIIILSVWVDSNFSDFQDDNDLYKRLLAFTNEVNSTVLKNSIDRQTITKYNIIDLYETMKSELLPVLLIQHTSISSQNPSSLSASSGRSLNQSGSNSSSLSSSGFNTLSKQDKNSVFVSGQQIIDWISKHCDIGTSTAENIFKKFIKVKVIASVGGFVSFSGKIQKELFFFVNIETPVLKSVHSKQFLDYNAQDIAKQLALMEFKMFQQIKMKEIYFKSWTSPKTKYDTSPNVMKLITNSNRIANWVATEIVTTPHPKKRVEVLKRMISIAEYCKKFNNYNSLMEIISGLNNSSVSRLKETWKNLPSSYFKSLNQMQNFLNTNENWKFYRQALKSRQIPCLPYLGLFLQDINFVEDGNSNTIPDEEELINFKKMSLLTNVFSEIQYFQKHPYYSFTNQPHVQVFLESDLIILPEKELYDFSKFIESPTNPLNKFNKYIV
ncbi:Ras guanine nucleotide exchange factor [Tieghemostelium lacteum]|uniref:Ras guanine nucleotide exchange factor n=1 Tax=Tieghemostelium lacteum TaxID=361077 RepID=A0A151ZFV5_TIELA|nr:Ras guanine nucleotide exchange factor [Tieghemostelium lacteum]|eukprot:KYQ92815.1 Ras guanine nucleotide exchange factor [Tieghemostelium lacteum]